MKQELSFSWLKLVNNFLQLLFIRLTKYEQINIESFVLKEISIVPFIPTNAEVALGIGGTIKKQRVEAWYSIQFFIVPFTGWESDFRYIGSPKFLRITRKNVFY